MSGRKQQLLSSFFSPSKAAKTEPSSLPSPGVKRKQPESPAAAHRATQWDRFGIRGSGSGSSSSSSRSTVGSSSSSSNSSRTTEQKVEIAKQRFQRALPPPVSMDTTDHSSGSSSSTNFVQKPSTNGPMVLTPLEKQYVAIQAKNPDVILFVEVGYKYRVFGPSAAVVADILDIYCHQAGNFLTASVPTYRIGLHVRKIVAHGYKVGVVRQTEKAALKKAEGSSGPFNRELEELYTKATLVSEDFSLHETGASSPAKFIMCLSEHETKEENVRAGLQGHTAFSFVAVDPSSGDIIYDDFQDNFMRGALLTRLHQLQPSEILLPATGISTYTHKIINQLKDTRMDELDPKRYPFHPTPAGYTNSLFAKLPRLSSGVSTCLTTLVEYLKDFKLNSLLNVAGNFHQFADTSRMLLDGATLSNLEILRSEDDEYKGSLWWLLGTTKTAPGSRLLKLWISQPLIDRSLIEARQEAVSELMLSKQPWVVSVSNLLCQIPDLERGMSRVQFKRCTPKEFLVLITTFAKIGSSLPINEIIEKEVKSSFLQRLFLSIDIPRLRTVTESFVSLLNKAAAEAGNLSQLYTNTALFPELLQCQQGIKDCESKLQVFLKRASAQLGYPKLEYKSLKDTEYLIEVRVQDSNKPFLLEWKIYNKTKTHVRYHPPEVTQLLQDLAFHREQQEVKAELAWKQFLQKFSDNYALFRTAIQQISILDCVYALATVSKRPGYCKPVFEDEQTLVVKQARHPILEQVNSDPFVPNDLELRHDGEKFVIITGPNMGGKSSFIRSMALLVIMAQIGCYVPAASISLSVFDAVFTRMGASDCLASGRSTFLVELGETSLILQRATRRSLVILDELGRGTSTHDGVAIASATLEHIINSIGCFTMFVTHYPLLSALQEKYPNIGNYHMSFVEKTDGEGKQSITFLYKATKGMCANSYGLNVARLAGVPDSVLVVAKLKADQIRKYVENSQSTVVRKILGEVESVLHGGPRDTVLELQRLCAQRLYSQPD